ncbi:hypothetical protein [Hymenobacter sp. GOD-10R]|uniref:tetratricopeptide repeat protein n=1 Tax=Hymenobacter sp. GOD-10R TaxID=3093922 RepID=UPI002D767A72|nr:hypothetical protein [Hymenobacter sp. GOD-10R]WRQ28893.1 hypothetical protein SD425_01270 [Hymenobacter sp. GOD-10R]
MKKLVWLAALLLLAAATPTQAQRKVKIKTKPGTAAPLDKASRLLPLFGGASAAQAEQVVGPAFLADVAKSFASRTEASKFFSDKGYEYLVENQPDTAVYRFNLAWLLDQKNADAYRGLGVIASQRANNDEAISLITQALAIEPTNAQLMADLGASYLIQYEKDKKKKSLSQAMDYLQKAIATDPKNAGSWQQLARGYYLQENFAKAWEAVHTGQNLNMTSLDFQLIGDLIAKMPDPEGKFK